MSDFAANTHLNIKQVMRTALVGISPADQLMLKGYLRVLLRLEADLEWVSANHPQVDLLFINEEFRKSDSVQRLLSSNPEKPILFVRRSQNDQGGLEGDTLTIPLKELPTLNRWLMQYVNVLKGKNIERKGSDSDASINRSQNSVSTNASSQAVVSEANNEFNSTMTNSSPNTLASERSKPKAALSPQGEPLVEFAKLVSKRPKGRYELLVDGIGVGIADLERQRLWLSRDNIVFNDTWQLVSTKKPLPEGTPIDLFQWIWSKVWATPKGMPTLVSNNNTYQIRYWPKPSAKEDRTQLLRVFTALESKPQRISDIESLTETPTAMVKKIIAGLLLSGGLQAAAYDSLNNLAPKASVQPSNLNNANEQVGDKAVSKPAVSTGSALEDALQRRASGQSASMTSTIDINIDERETNPSPSPAHKKTEKSGFLSRLRKKLGL